MTTLVQEDLAISLVEDALQASEVAIDTETDFWKGKHRDIRDGTGKACGVSIAYRDTSGITALFLPFRYLASNYDLSRFSGLLQQILDRKPIIFHNAKFDLVSLTTLGLDTSGTRFLDTMLLAHLIDENNPIQGKSLDALCKYYLKNDGKHFTKQLDYIAKKMGWDMIPAEMLADYATTDAVLTLQLMEHLRPMVQAEKLKDMWLHKEQFARLVIKMESRGVRIDTELAAEQATIGESRMLEIVGELGGFTPSKPGDLYQLLCVQLGLPEIMHPKTGNRTFDKDAMEEYEIVLEHINNPTARRILEYRGWQKTVTSNYRPYIKLLSPDGRLRPNYKMHGTKTGRMSCAEPNLQQIPRESTKEWNGHLKRAFLPNEGSVLMEFDYSQLELRLGTAYAQDADLIQIFREGRDVFTEMSGRVGLSRQDTKTMVYSIQYGAGVNRISNVFGVSATTAKERIESYYSAYPNFRKVSKQVEQIVRRHGKVPLWSGRFRHFYDPAKQGYKAFNSVMQGGAADIVEKVMVKLDQANLPGTKMLLTVHDSVVFEIEHKYREKVTPEITRIMEDVDGATGQQFGVKFAVDSKVWGK